MRLMIATTTLLSLALSACVVAPATPVYAPAPHPTVVRPAYPVQAPPPAVVYSQPPGVVYVAPTYAMPAPGFIWRHHPQYGWGWHHSSHGWHRGWR